MRGAEERLRDATVERFPDMWVPGRSDLCFATTNRQTALLELVPRVVAENDLILPLSVEGDQSDTCYVVANGHARALHRVVAGVDGLRARLGRDGRRLGVGQRLLDGVLATTADPRVRDLAEAVVDGPLVFKREVNLYVHSTARIGRNKAESAAETPTDAASWPMLR